MLLQIEILGYGFFFSILRREFLEDRFTILAWSIMRKHMIWRGESHTKSVGCYGGYNYRCYKNGEQVENFSFQSPIVNHIGSR